MAYIPQSALDLANGNLTRNLMLYLAQYLKTATGGRVECYSQITEYGFNVKSFIRFKCKECQDNWNVGSHLFAGGGIPTELTDWVEKHQHVCKEFQLPGPRCKKCQWSWDKHKEGKPYQDSKGDWIIPSYAPGQIVNVDNPKTYISSFTYPGQFQKMPFVPGKIADSFIYAPVPASPKVVQLKEVQGRKFRE